VGLDQTELELLSVMSETAPSRSDDVGSEIAQSLSSTFGVNRLRDQATHFGARAKELDRDADERRKELRDTPLKEGVTQRTEIEANLVATRMEIEEINGRLAESQRIAKVTKEWQDHDEAVKAHEVWLRIDAERLRSLHELIDNSGLTEVSSISVLERQDLPELIRLLRALSESETRDVGRCEALLSLTAQLMAQINSEDGVCPVCRRPLLAHDAERALLEHEETRERLTAELADARTKLETLGDLLERAELAERNDSPRMPAAPEHPRPDSAADVAERNVETQALFVTADARRADFEAQLRSIDAQESTLRSNEVLSRGLFDTYRIAERSYVAADVLDSLADLVVARRIEPLANEMQKRWSHIWSGEPLIMNEQGTLSLEIDGASVPYSEFSGGQRTVANVILRLLTLELTAVKAFAVLDEPLEHLDPKNRRLLASLLVRASQPPSRIEQLLVTTYEESVTRRLSPWQGSNTSTGARITYLESAS
jgi:DNA repair exonuclease SbcCD ATPase subunit